MMRKFFLLAIICALFFSGGLSWGEDSSCQPRKTYVFYGNGMFNSQNAATAALEQLQVRMRQAGGLSTDEWGFELSFNHNEGLFSLFEVYRQRQGEQATGFWRWVGNLESAPDWFREVALDVASAYNRTEAIIDADLQRHVQRYRSVLLEGNRALLVAHSQGNLYANSAYSRLSSISDIPMESLGVVAVATPSGYVAGGGPYFTQNDDLVINAVRLAYPDTLPGNVSNAGNDVDWKHHAFVESYLWGNPSGSSIVQAALNVAEGLPWPQPQMGSGPITVTMTWGGQPDVDLHVYEPNGAHIYYSNMRGPSGYLDVDDVSGYGPEHYYVVDCDHLEAGIYRVGVNYFGGRAPELASVQVQAGEIVRSFTTPLPTALGTDGDDNPVLVTRIEVAGNLTEGYQFSVGSGGTN